MSLVLNSQRSRPETSRLIFSENYAPPGRIAMEITNVGVDGGQLSFQKNGGKDI